MVQWIVWLTRDQGDFGSSPTQGTKTNFFLDECNSGLIIKENLQLINGLFTQIIFI